MRILPLLFIGLLLLGAGCTKDTWRAFYYPDASDLSRDERSWELDSVEECRAWVKVQQTIYNPDGRQDDDYECCKNGRYDAVWDAYVCKETVR
jgi:hypothetical protein